LETKEPVYNLIVTPEIAKKWLTNLHPRQRNCRSTAVNRLASDMEAGRFGSGADMIVLVSGKLANGQHRLNAIVQTGKAQEFVVRETEDESIMDRMDVGLKRTTSDSLIGIPYNKELPSIARWVMSYKSGSIRPGDQSGKHMTAARCVSSHSAVTEYCHENTEMLVEAASFIAKLYKNTRLLNKSIGGALHCITSTNPGGHELMKEFLQKLYIGGEGADVLRNRLISNLHGNAKVPPGYLFIITIKAYNKYCAGLESVSLRHSKDEAFPRLWFEGPVNRSAR